MNSSSKPKRNKQRRRASLTMAGSLPRGGPMLSLFAPTAAPDKKKKNRRASISICSPTVASFESTVGVPPAPKPQPRSPSPEVVRPTQQQRPPPPPSPIPSQQHYSQWLLDEVEISGMELLRSESVGTGDSFSYESYARDSFALANGRPQPGAIRTGMLHRTPSECRISRRMSNCSSIGVDSAGATSDWSVMQPTSHHHPHHQNNPDNNHPQPQSYQLKNWPASRRRSSCGGVSNAGLEYNSYYGYGQASPAHHIRRNQRRASMESGSGFRLSTGLPSGVRSLSRRGSTGTYDLPGFGAYKARRRASNNGGTNMLGYEPAVMAAGPLSDSLPRRNSFGRRGSYGRRGSMGSYGRRGSMGSFKGRRGSVGSCDKDGGALFGLNSDTFHSYGTYGSYGRRGSLGSGSFGRRGSMGSGDKDPVMGPCGGTHENFRRMSIDSCSTGGRPRI